MNWHKLTIDETFKFLGTKKEGLNNIQAEEKLLTFGLNELKEKRKKSVFVKGTKTESAGRRARSNHETFDLLFYRKDL